MIKSEIAADLVTVFLKGRLDISADSEVVSQLKALVSDNLDKDFIIEMSEVEYLPSSGLSMLVRTKRDLAIENKSLKLVGLKAPVKKIFDVSGLADHFEMFSSIEKAKGAE